MDSSNRGASLPKILDGPPDKINAAGARFKISSRDVSGGRISECTFCSRTRRAINWVYWDPKSKMTTPFS